MRAFSPKHRLRLSPHVSLTLKQVAWSRPKMAPTGFELHQQVSAYVGSSKNLKDLKVSSFTGFELHPGVDLRAN